MILLLIWRAAGGSDILCFAQVFVCSSLQVPSQHDPFMGNAAVTLLSFSKRERWRKFMSNCSSSLSVGADVITVWVGQALCTEST